VGFPDSCGAEALEGEFVGDCNVCSVGLLIECSLSANCGLSLLNFCVRETWLRVSQTVAQPLPTLSRCLPSPAPLARRHRRRRPPVSVGRVPASVRLSRNPPSLPLALGCCAKRYFPERLLPISALGHPIHPLSPPRTTATHRLFSSLPPPPPSPPPFAPNITRISSLIFNSNGDGTDTRRPFLGWGH